MQAIAARCAALIAIKDATFGHVRERLTAGLPVTECGLQDFMMAQFAQRRLETDHPPIVAVNAHAADPHFAPRRDADTPLRPGDFLLLDLWGREPHPARSTATSRGWAMPARRFRRASRQVFELVRQARDAAVAFTASGSAPGRSCMAMRWMMPAGRYRSGGLWPHFIHRTGHSIGASGHGNGVNLDNLETQDRRRLIPGVGFSVEPGIYLPEEGFGVRLEINCYVTATDVEVTTLPIQDEMVLLAG